MPHVQFVVNRIEQLFSSHWDAKKIKALFILQGVSQPFKMDSGVCVSMHGFTAAAVLFYCLNWRLQTLNMNVNCFWLMLHLKCECS